MIHRQRISLTLAFVCSVVACCGTRQPENSALEANKNPETEIIFYKDEAGNSIKRDGWFSTDFERGKRLRNKSEEMLTADGRTIMIEISAFEYPKPLIIERAFGDYEFGSKFGAGKATWGTEFRGKNNSTPYCISFILHMANPPASEDNSFHDHGVATRYCDADGDGVFETRPGEDFRTPAWVK